jgi:hypothetical protein
MFVTADLNGFYQSGHGNKRNQQEYSGDSVIKLTEQMKRSDAIQ